MTLESEFTSFSARKLRQLNERIGEALGRLSDEQIWMRGSDEQNAIGNLVLHLAGNVRQWIGYGAGKLENIRDRDAEFAARGGTTGAELRKLLSARVEEACAIIESLNAARLLEQVVIQKYNITVLEAVYHSVEHFSQHTGQILFATKLLTGRGFEFYSNVGAAAPRDATP